MKTIGQILQEKRIAQKITLEQVSTQTKIRQDILMALEQDDFQKLSSPAAIKGFLKTYAEFLGFSPQQTLAIFRRDFDKKEKKKVIPQGMLNPIDKGGFNWTPKTTLFLVVAIFVLGLAGWLIYQYLSLTRPPFLKIIQPNDKQTFTQETIEVFGQADSDALVTINQETVLLTSQGEFHHQLNLFPGENNLVVEATSKLGKKTKMERTVFLNKSD
jgi:cytoskeletal protein RodZ